MKVIRCKGCGKVAIKLAEGSSIAKGIEVVCANCKTTINGVHDSLDSIMGILKKSKKSSN